MSEQTEPLSPPLQDTADQPDLPEGWLAVQSMDLDAQGVARKPDGKVVFAYDNLSADDHVNQTMAALKSWRAKNPKR